MIYLKMKGKIVMDCCMIEIAFDNREEVDKVINELLDEKLVASCQVIESSSYWNWNAKREYSHEYLLFIKTKKELSREIYDIVKTIHSYKCFEFAIFDIFSCNDEYINWINKETK